MSKALVITSVGVALIVVAVGAFMLFRKDPANSTAAPLVSNTALDALPVKDGSSADISHLASSVIPPTNSWLSGMVLQETPKPVFPMPLSFLAKEAGFEIGLPTITVDPSTITGGHIAGIAASIKDASSFQLTRYDKVSAALTYKDTSGANIGRLTLAEGVPFVYYRALESGSMTVTDIVPSQGSSVSSYLRYTKAGHDYVVLADKPGVITLNGTTASLKLDKNSLVTLYALPDANPDKLREYAGNELAGVSTAYDVKSDKSTTTLEYKTINNQPTVYAPMGYAQVTGQDPVVASYENIYGRMQAFAGNKLIMSAPLSPVTNRLDLANVSTEHREALIKTLENDIASTKITAQDSYYAGKQLGRAANLLEIAMQLDQTSSAEKLRTILKDEMKKRLDGSYFYYDSKLKGVAATTKAFGSEDFNDHHFHYGNFIYAASILGRYDEQFLSEYRDKINLLVADIASYDQTDTFPQQRNYDAFAGHSWAAGLAPFADGNNQESSSEAMNAWNAVAVWGQLVGNDKLATTGQWMLSHESAAARDAWRTPPTEIPNRTNYTSPITSLNFGGKLTYATFFSDEPNAKLGIQLISMNPFMTELAKDGPRIAQLVDATTENDNFNRPLADYILMYLSLHEPQRALELAAKQQDAFIDDGNSRTYLNAFIFSQSDRQ